MTIDWELFPQASVNEKVSWMMTNLDTLPDAAMGLDFTPSDQVNYGSQGIFLPLQDYIEDIGVFTKEVYDEETINEITAPDGNLYALAGINDCYHCLYPGKLWINQQWLDNLGLDYPETTEELRTVLEAFRDEDANGNGDPDDEIPMMGATSGWNTSGYDALLNSFVYNDYDMRVALNDGKIEFVANTDEWKEALLYVRGLIEDGLLDPASLTQTEEQFVQVAGDPNEVLVGVVSGATWWSGLGPDATDPLQRSRQYVGLSPVEGPNGVRNTLSVAGGLATGKFVITENAEDPELIFRWADGLLSEEATYVSSWGKLGEGWLEPDEGALGINGKPALYKIPDQKGGEDDIRTDWMPNVALAARTNDFRLGQQLPDYEEEAMWSSAPRLYRDTKEYFEPFDSEDQQLPTLMYLPEESDELAPLQTQIKTFVDEWTDNFLAGNRDIEADWDAYLNEFDVLGLDRMLEIMQTAYDRQYGDD